MPGFSATPRNSAVSGVNGTALSLTNTLTVTSTVLGDLGVVAIGYSVSNPAGARTWTPPTGWSLVRDTFPSVANAAGQAMFYNPALAAGVTSLAFTLAVASGAVASVNAIYGCWPGGTGRTLAEGVNAATTTTSTTTMPSVTMASACTTADLLVWAGSEYASGTAPGTPTGTGTWVSVNTETYYIPGIRMAAQVGSRAVAGAASGSSCTASAEDYISQICGFSQPSADGFFIL